MIGLVLPVKACAAEDERPAILEVSLESRMMMFDTDFNRLLYTHEIEVGLGLAWEPNAWVSVHGRLSLGWNTVIDNAFSYRFHNDLLYTSHLGNIEIAAFLDVHPCIPVLTLRAELSASSYFIEKRAGIWLINAGIGLGAQPFSELHSTLRNTYFGVIFRFPVFDGFDKIFSTKRRMPQIGLQISWGF